MSAINRVILAVVLAATATQQAAAAEVAYELPGLIGSYEVGALHSPGDAFDRSSVVGTDLDWATVDSIVIHLEGDIQPGRIRGDGVLRPADEVDFWGILYPCPGFPISLLPHFNFNYWNPMDRPDIPGIPDLSPLDTLQGLWTPPPGAFQHSWRVVVPNGPSMPGDDFCVTPDLFATTIWALFLTDRGRLPDFFVEPSEEMKDANRFWWVEGLEITEPATLEITNAWVVVNTVPEPGTLALMAAGISAAWMRRRRSGRA